LAYDKSEFRTQDEAFLFDQLELAAARRTNFALRLGQQNEDNRLRRFKRRVFPNVSHTGAKDKYGLKITITA
jgi:hypothetical protein